MAGGAALGLTFGAGLWLWPVYAYNYNNDYHYHNTDDNEDVDYKVVCLCEKYQECGCDNNNNSTYYDSLFNGTAPHNTSTVQVIDEKGNHTIYINGTLPNGTTAADGTSAATGAMTTLAQSSGFLVAASIALASVWIGM